MCGRAASSTLATSTAATALSLGLGETSQINAEEKGEADAVRHCPSIPIVPNETKEKDTPNAGPGNEFHVFRRTNRTIQRERMTWGLIPNNGTEHSPHLLPHDSSFSVSPHYAMFNARTETLYEKPSFRGLARNGQTCVIPLDGYYEWSPKQPHEKKKQPYFIRYRDRQRPLLMAGVWSRVKTGRKIRMADSANVEEETLATFAILTTDAHSEYAWLHPRQPVMLWDIPVALEWLMSPNPSLMDKLRSVPINGSLNDRQKSIWESSLLSVYPVTTKMNECKYQGDDCMLEVRLEKVRSIKSFFLPQGSKKARTGANTNQSSASPTHPSSKTSPSTQRLPLFKTKEVTVKENTPDAVSQNNEVKEISWTCSRCTFTHTGLVKSRYLVCELCQAERKSS